MSQFLKGVLAISIIPIMMVGCTTAPQKKGKILDLPKGHRIHIPQETVTIERPVRPKVTPNSYLNWLQNPSNRIQIQEYEQFLSRNDVANIVPNYELLKTALYWEPHIRIVHIFANRELFSIMPFLHYVCSNI